jgi:hypothetical protein
MHSVYKNEHRIFKSIEITIRKGLIRKKKNRGGELIPVTVDIYMEMSQGNSSSFFFFYEIGE